MIVTLTDFTPVERYDNTAWTTALIYEGAAATGPFTLIDTVTLDPTDTDPSNPLTRDFTLTTATIEQGWYQVEWQDGAGVTSVAPPVQNLRLDRAYRPLVSDVGLLLRTRTINTDGATVGTFTADTIPTYQQADQMIDRAMGKLEARFGPTMNPELVGSAREVVALRAAMLIELAYFGNQIRADRSPFQELNALYNQALTDWQYERRSVGVDGIPDTADDTSGNALPRSIFPAPTDYVSDSMTGRGPGWEGAVW